MSDQTSDDVSPMTRLTDQATKLTINSLKGEPIVRLGLTVTLFFKHGETAEIKQRVAECFAEFRDAFKVQLKWQFYKTLRKMTASSFANCRRRILASSPDEQFIWSIGSGTLQQVAEHRMFFMNTPLSQSPFDRSCLKMVLPWTMLLEPGGAQRYERWLKFLCDQVSAEHGYGGLACTLPYDGQQHFPQEYVLANQYIGLMVDPLPHVESLRLTDHIKGVNWFTVLGSRFVNRLGGSDTLRRKLSGCSDITFQTYDHGLIIRAGCLPNLGGPGQDAPASYVEVNKAIKPVRMRTTGSLHSYSIPGETFGEIASAAWYARFDDKPPVPLDAGERCTCTGYWSSNATARSRCLFNEGDVMPAFPHMKGRTRWFWLQGVE